MREAIFKRDRFLCQQCLRDGRLKAVDLHGRNAGHCDHIVPEAEGGKTVATNLETLCGVCHRRKSSQEARRGLERALTARG